MKLPCPVCNKNVEIVDDDGRKIYTGHGNGSLADGNICEGSGWVVESDDLPVRKSDVAGLTSVERLALHGEGVDPSIRQFLDQYGDELADRTTAFRKVAAAARAEADALVAVRDLASTRRVIEATGTRAPRVAGASEA
jgi:hypothetical protein